MAGDKGCGMTRPVRDFVFEVRDPLGTGGVRELETTEAGLLAVGWTQCSDGWWTLRWPRSETRVPRRPEVDAYKSGAADGG